jgi:hypothetical protein
MDSTQPDNTALHLQQLLFTSAACPLFLPLQRLIAVHDEHTMDQSEQRQEWLRSQTISSPLSPQQPTISDYVASGSEPPLQQGMGEFVIDYCLSTPR